MGHHFLGIEQIGCFLNASVYAQAFGVNRNATRSQENFQVYLNGTDRISGIEVRKHHPG